MKRKGYIYEKICDIENIKTAIYNASKGKRKRRKVRQVLKNIDYHANNIHQMLVNRTYSPHKTTEKKIHDGNNGKDRIIHKPRFYPDQIIQWALMLQIDRILLKGMYQYSCGSIPGRGTSYAKKTIRKWLDKDRKNTKYCLKMDIKKFYPSVNNEILKNLFRRKIKDRDCLWLIDTIIDQEQGLPIGFYTSQWFSNFFLNDFDHYIKHKLKAKYYIRYVDDLVLFGPNKKKLHRVRKEIERQLNLIDLQLKGNWQVFRVDKRAVDFLGFRFFRHKTILRKRNALRIRRRIRKIAKKGHLNERDAQAVMSYWGWIKASNSFNFYHNHIRPTVSINKAKKVVSECAKIRNNRRWPVGNKHRGKRGI